MAHRDSQRRPRACLLAGDAGAAYSGSALAWTSLAAIVLLIAALFFMTRTREGPRAGSLVLYCAAGMKPAVETIAAEYAREYGVDVTVEYGGSGKLLAIIEVEREAPRADLYLAADAGYTREAQRKGLVAETIPVAHMQPVIAVHPDAAARVARLEDLLRDDVHVVLANPELAAVGRTARRILEEAGLWARLEARTRELRPGLVFAGTVTEVANNLKIGAADAGIVWDVTLKRYPDLVRRDDPRLASGTQEVTVAVTAGTRQPAAALRFARYLTARDRGLLHFAREGWKVVEGDAWAEIPEIVLYSGGVNRPAIEETLAEFERREGVKISVKYGGCGILVSDMRGILEGGIPAAFPDAYFACDRSFIPPVAAEFREPVDVSDTEMVLLVRRGNPKGIRTLRDLARPGIRIAAANEEHSALGALTRRLLEAEGLWEAVRKNITFQAPSADPLVLRMRVGGGEDVAVVYRANTTHAGEELEVIPIDHPLAHAVQPLVISKTTRYPQLLGRLRETLLSPRSRERFLRAGFHWRGGEAR